MKKTIWLYNNRISSLCDIHFVKWAFDKFIHCISIMLNVNYQLRLLKAENIFLDLSTAKQLTGQVYNDTFTTINTTRKTLSCGSYKLWTACCISVFLLLLQKRIALFQESKNWFAFLFIWCSKPIRINEMWLHNNSIPAKHSRVCNLHFLKSDLILTRSDFIWFYLLRSD